MTRLWISLLAAASCCAHAAETLLIARAAETSLHATYYAASGRPPRPAAILVHGGGFTGGHRDMPAMAELAALFNNAGADALSIDYRLAPAHPFPAPVEDVEHAILWLRRHASERGVDRKRLVLVGASAGANLAMMAAVRNAPVSAVIAFYGLSDFRNQPLAPNRRAYLARLLESIGEQAAFSAASPAMQITGREPPFLLIHGDRDTQVPMDQSVHMQTALQRQSVPCELILIPGGGHGLLNWSTLPDVRPWKVELLDWLARVWKIQPSARHLPRPAKKPD
jgi:acetyl esterase/lipase